MPSPLITKNKENILFSIEDNGTVNFKPYIIRSKVSDNWSTEIGGNSINRTYALADKIDDSVYAGAPYLRQLQTRELVLSYQGTENRLNKMSNAEMKVVIGSEKGNDFNRKTSPFFIPANRAGLWNSISVLDDNTVIALTSTNAYSNSNTEIWMIKGHVIPELTALKMTLTIDGLKHESIWDKELPIFIGHKGATQLRSIITYDDKYLYAATNITDSTVSKKISDPENNDGVTVYIDAANKSYTRPHTGIFSILLSADNKVIVKEGKIR
ncbi:MAG: sugar-binding protein [Segetibacter sp.]